MKIYQVIFQDEYNNLYLLGMYKHLEDATDDINGYLDTYNVSIKAGDIKEYPGTFGSCFDTYVSDVVDDEENGCMIRGFVLDSEDVEQWQKDTRT